MKMMRWIATLALCSLSVMAGFAAAEVPTEPIEASDLYSPPEYEPTGIVTAFNYGASVIELDGQNFYILPDTWIWLREEGRTRRLESPVELMGVPLVGKRVHYLIPEAESHDLTHLLIMMWVPEER